MDNFILPIVSQLSWQPATNFEELQIAENEDFRGSYLHHITINEINNASPNDTGCTYQ